MEKKAGKWRQAILFRARGHRGRDQLFSNLMLQVSPECPLSDSAVE
jgi:hypothetical protein